jgi:hypothetical protein
MIEPRTVLQHLVERAHLDCFASFHPLIPQDSACRDFRVKAALLTLEYPLCARGIFSPWAVISQVGVCEDDELAHDGGDGDKAYVYDADERVIEPLRAVVLPEKSN